MARLKRNWKSKDVCMMKDYGASQETTRRLFCSFCKKMFHSRHALDRHSKIHLREGELACEICGKIVNNYLSLKYTHPGETNLLSEVNEKLLKNEFAMKNVSQSEGNKTYVCEICKHRFADEITFVMHYRKHKIKKPSLCYKCSQM